MGFFAARRRGVKADNKQAVAVWLRGSGVCPEGYHRLTDCPEYRAVVDAYAAVIGSATIYLMENGKQGDKRLHNALSRKIDIEPWSLGTRQIWVSWIVSTMLGEGDGNAYVLPHIDLNNGNLLDLEPMPGAVAQPIDSGRDYRVLWQGKLYPRDTVIPFRIYPDPDSPWRGRGWKASADNILKSLAQTEAVKSNLSSPDYQPPMIVYVDLDQDIFGDSEREKFRHQYLEDVERGKPWVLPSDVAKVDRWQPLNLSDLAIKDGVELDRKALASLTGTPAFMLGVGAFNKEEYNNWIRSRVLPICQAITQPLTLCLLDNPKWYFVMPEKRLYNYTPMELVSMGLALADHGFANGDEVRDMAMLDPAGLTEFRALENFIPYDMAALQNKLQPQTGGNNV